MQGAQVQFLVGELRSQMLCGVAKQKNKGIFLLSERDTEAKQESTIYLMGSGIRVHISLPNCYHFSRVWLCATP